MDEGVRRIEIGGDMDRVVAEMLQLEIRRLAKRCGLDIKELRIEKVAEEGRDASA